VLKKLEALFSSFALGYKNLLLPMLIGGF